MYDELNIYIKNKIKQDLKKALCHEPTASAISPKTNLPIPNTLDSTENDTNHIMLESANNTSPRLFSKRPSSFAAVTEAYTC